MNPTDFVTVADGLGTNEADHRTAIGRYYYAVFNRLRDDLAGPPHSVAFAGHGGDHEKVKNCVHLLDTGAPTSGGPTAQSMLTTLHGLRKRADYKLGQPVTAADRMNAQNLVRDLRAQTGKW